MRKYSSLFLFYTLIAMIITGIVLYIEPHGRIAYWGGWTFLGLDKDQWESLHLILGLVMLIAGVIHLIVNWKVIKKYIKSKKDRILSREFVISTIVALLIAVGTIYNVPPFNYIIEVGEKIKDSWEQPTVKPPEPHAELFSLKKIADIVGIDVKTAIDVLADHEIKVESPRQKLKEISKENGLPPYKIYEILLTAKEELNEETAETGNQ